MNVINNLRIMQECVFLLLFEFHVLQPMHAALINSFHSAGLCLDMSIPRCRTSISTLWYCSES